MVLNKYITKAKVIYITLGNAPGAQVCSWTITCGRSAIYR